MAHNSRCERAKSPVCKCSCGGKRHAKHLRLIKGVEVGTLDPFLSDKSAALSRHR